MTRTPTLILLAAALAVATPVAAQNNGAGRQRGRSDRRYPVDPTTMPRPSLAAHRIDTAIKIDGHLDEAAWAEADSSTSDWIQVQPRPGYPASEPTTIKILYDDHALYVGATLYESEPEKLISPGLEQDFSTHDSDILGVAIDTYHDKQNGFLFAVNPAGALWDAQVFNEGEVSIAWEGIVNVRTSIGPDRWTVEMEIPFATLRYNPVHGEQVWGLAFNRRIRHLNEESNWAPTERQHKLYKFSLAGTLTGLRDLQTGHNLWMKPYVLGARSTGSTLPEADNRGDGGLDVKWGLTPRMTLDLTANTDFSQVEVDQEQVKLDRFNLFFPEKRDFFLENEGTFAFQDAQFRNYRTGSNATKFKLFHSRRIGLSPGGTALPIAGGARLTGKLSDRTEVGFLEMQTRTDGPVDDPGLYPAENFAVARVRQLLANGSNVGVMFVNRQQTAGSGGRNYNRSYGVDGNVTLFNDLILSAYAAHTDELNPTGDSRDAAMFQAAWRNPFWDMSVLLKHIGDDFNPGLGFVDRKGVRRMYATVGAHPQVKSAKVFEINPYVETDFYQNLSGDLESRTLSPSVAVNFTDGGILTLSVSDRYERLFEPLSIAGNEVPVGTYGWREARASYFVAGSHKVSGVFSVTGGDFYDGTRLSLYANTHFRPNVHFNFDLGVQHNALKLGGTSFNADVFNARVRWAGNTRTFLMGFVQYNQQTEELITNVRFNLIHAPLSDLFLVYTERRSLSSTIADAVLERGLTLKVTKLFAF